MQRWRLVRRIGGEAPAAGAAREGQAEEGGGGGRTPVLAREPLGGLDDPYFLLNEVRFQMRVDEAASVPVAVGEQNACAILDSTQRVRECRERERSSAPPVYNFGSEGSWSGGGDW